MHERERTFMDDVRSVDPVFYIGIGIGIGFLLAAIVFNSDFLNREFLDGLAPEAVGIIFTVIVLDRLAERRAKREAREELKQRLIRQMGSKVNEEAVRAAEELWSYGWLQDGSLCGRYFWAAELQGADLEEANLQNAELGMANLAYTKLYGARLQGASLWGANFHNAQLQWANFQNASLVGTNLSGVNFYIANLAGANLEKSVLDETTILPDGAKWTSKSDLNRFTNSDHPDFWQPEPDIDGNYPNWWYLYNEDPNP